MENGYLTIQYKATKKTDNRVIFNQVTSVKHNHFISKIHTASLICCNSETVCLTNRSWVCSSSRPLFKNQHNGFTVTNQKKITIKCNKIS